jgi:Protein of unknown function (DUF3300)
MNTARWKVPSRVLAVLCAALLVPGEFPLYAQQDPAGQPPPPPEKMLSAEQLESLVAPIALYPDPLLGQVLAACTYPLEAVEADRWVQGNKNLKGEKLVQAAAQQDWEPSIQALVVFPDVLNRISQNLKWSTALGNAFLAQEQDMMNAVQAMRRKAQQSGSLQSNSQQNVATESGNVIVIQPANPQVIYVPNYNPTVIYGPPPMVYPYPVMVYPPPPSTGAIVAASLISFGAGIALGAAFHGCCGPSYGWGWGCNWRGGSVTVNNNFFGRYGYATPYGAGSGAWAHNPYYRGAVPYSSAAVAGRYGAAAGVRTPYGAAGAVRTPYGAAAGVRTPYGAAGAVKTPYGSAAAVKTPYGTAARTTTTTPYGSTTKTATPYGSASRTTTPYGTAGTASGKYGSAAGIKTANGAAGAVSTPYRNAAGVKTPTGTTVKTNNGTYSSGSRPPGSGGAPSNAFGGGGAASTRANSNRGASSMSGWGGNGRTAGGGGARRR